MPLTPEQRLDEIAAIFEMVDSRILAGDGPCGEAGAFQREITDTECCKIYALAKGLEDESN